ncbi:MAG: hypothetical protein M1822_006278 [Bathelium mastoideum]|nr:MAG: hypothetical protein M1822_006278 [Bathelium mastoideum]
MPTPPTKSPESSSIPDAPRSSASQWKPLPPLPPAEQALPAAPLHEHPGQADNKQEAHRRKRSTPNLRTILFGREAPPARSETVPPIPRSAPLLGRLSDWKIQAPPIGKRLRRMSERSLKKKPAVENLSERRSMDEAEGTPQPPPAPSNPPSSAAAKPAHEESGSGSVGSSKYGGSEAELGVAEAVAVAERARVVWVPGRGRAEEKKGEEKRAEEKAEER